jgi:hypothetical protein
MMQSKLLLVLSIVSAAILISGVIQTSAMAYPQQKQGYSHHNKMMMQPGLYAFGTIASLQNDENGNPTWIVSGLWEGSLSMDNKIQGGEAIKPLILQMPRSQQVFFPMQHFIPKLIW